LRQNLNTYFAVCKKASYSPDSDRITIWIDADGRVLSHEDPYAVKLEAASYGAPGQSKFQLLMHECKDFHLGFRTADPHSNLLNEKQWQSLLDLFNTLQPLPENQRTRVNLWIKEIQEQGSSIYFPSRLIEKLPPRAFSI
jgi:hypothetical protein